MEKSPLVKNISVEMLTNGSNVWLKDIMPDGEVLPLKGLAREATRWGLVLFVPMTISAIINTLFE